MLFIFALSVIACQIFATPITTNDLTLDSSTFDSSEDTVPSLIDTSDTEIAKCLSEDPTDLSYRDFSDGNIVQKRSSSICLPKDHQQHPTSTKPEEPNKPFKMKPNMSNNRCPDFLYPKHLFCGGPEVVHQIDLGVMYQYVVNCVNRKSHHPTPTSTPIHPLIQPTHNQTS